MNALLSAIVTWMTISCGTPAVYNHPRIIFASTEHISNLRYGEAPMGRRPHVVAIYDNVNRVIYLSNSWSPQSPADLSILVHEMVHHVQNVSKIRHACPAAREELAYAAQGRWLAMFGKNLIEEFEMDAMFLRMATLCPWT